MQNFAVNINAICGSHATEVEKYDVFKANFDVNFNVYWDISVAYF